MTSPTVCKCGAPMAVLDTRTTPGAIRRRRRCVACERKTTTYEVALPLIGSAILVRRVSNGVAFEAVSPRPALVVDSIGADVASVRVRGKK